MARLTSERAREIATARHAKDAEASTAPPDGWSSWPAYRLYLSDADGGRAPYRQHDPLAVRTYLEVASEAP